MAKSKTPRKKLPAPPSWLTADFARAVWKRVAGELDTLSIYRVTDGEALARYCQYVHDWIELTRELEKEGRYYTTSSEHVQDMRREHPAWSMRNDVERHLRVLESQFGLNPRMRYMLAEQIARARVPPPADQLPFGDGNTVSRDDAASDIASLLN